MAQTRGTLTLLGIVLTVLMLLTGCWAPGTGGNISASGTASNSGQPAAASSSAADCAHAVAAGGPQEICGFFIVQCQLDHTSHDDPIVFPGVPSATHLHEFFGARGIRHDSTPTTLLNSPTSCSDANDTGGYWTPAAQMSGRVVNSVYQNEYWFDGGFQKTELIPFGMKLVAGSSRSTADQSTQRVFYYCGTGSPKRSRPYDCNGAGGTGFIIMVVVFPTCWNGVRSGGVNTVDVAYPTGSGRCPSGFVHVFPRLEEHIHLPISSPYDSSGKFAFTLSSGPYYTLHGDYMNSWHMDELNAFVTTCINEHRVCGDKPPGSGRLPIPSPVPN